MWLLFFQLYTDWWQMDDGGENLLSETREQSFSILDPPPDGLFSIMGSSSTKLISYHTIMMMMVNMALQLWIDYMGSK